MSTQQSEIDAEARTLPLAEVPGAENENGAAEAAAEQAAPAVYDSEARQHIPVTLWQEDGPVDVTLICEPVADATLVHFAHMVAEAAAAESPDEDKDAALRLGGAQAAGCWLFNTLMSGVEGYGEEGEEMPGDWRDRLFGPREKAELVGAAVFGFEPIPPSLTKRKARPSWAASSVAVTSHFRVPFGGRTVEVSHTLRRPDARRLAEFMVANVADPDKLGGNLQRFAKGYDALHVAQAGYKGPVPMHHKARAYIHHMTRQGAAVRKN